MNLCETQRLSQLNIDSLNIRVTDIVLDFNEKVPRQFWKISIVTQVYIYFSLYFIVVICKNVYFT